MVKPHILALPFPAQGHVIPMMELSRRLVNHGFKVTFVNTDYMHKRVMNAMSSDKRRYFDDDQIFHLVSVPDGMEPWEDRSDLGKLLAATQSLMSKELEALVNKINNDYDDDNISCVIADETLSWAVEMAKKMNIKGVAFWPASAAMLAFSFAIPKLLEDGIINEDGVPLTNQNVQLTPEMPIIKPEHFVWSSIGDEATQRLVFHTMSKNNTIVKLADWILCNSSADLEPSAFNLAPQIKPIGPMFAGIRQGNHSEGNFWANDTTCLEWLDKQPPLSVIYVAFGSFTIFDHTQFCELALGLELLDRPFLWVVREDTIGEEDCEAKTNAYPNGFLERIAGLNGKIVSWSPQQKVLSHPSVACFLSHCGWNSTIEGLTNGVPFLCWPYFADQFLDESYLCDVWKVGLRFERDGSGIIRRAEIKNKVEQLLGDDEFRGRALKLKELALNSVSEGGNSDVGFESFVEWVMS